MSKYALFKDISFTVPTKKTTLFIGDNGSGKSTLFRLALGLLKPQSGDIYFERSKKNIKIAYLKQDTFFATAWYLSVKEFIALRLSPFKLIKNPLFEEKIERIAQFFEIQDILHKPLSALSLGQLKRAHLAQVFADEADLFVLDEPTVYLDSSGKEKLYAKLLEERQKNTTIVMCSHEFSHLPTYSDHIVCLTGRSQDSVYHDFISYFQEKNQTVTISHLHY